MRRLAFQIVSFSILVMLYGPLAHSNPGDAMTQQLQAVLDQALPRMACNLSPQWPKDIVRQVNGQPTQVRIFPAPGSVTASPQMDNPDYYYHWNRDSALVVGSLVNSLRLIADQRERVAVEKFIEDFIRLSDRLQRTPVTYGLGRTRFHIDGTVDETPWNYLQNDGPGLRALALLHYYQLQGNRLTLELKDLLTLVIQKDLDYISVHFQERSFDLWEDFFGFHFYTRRVQLGALEEALRVFPDRRTSAWDRAVTGLNQSLAEHWDPKRQIYTFSHLEPTIQPGQGLDSSIILGVLHSDDQKDSFSIRDDKVFSTAWKLEKNFLQIYPINQLTDLQKGPAIGRHEGDGYYGGNPWYLLTAAFGEYYYRMSRLVKDSADFSLIVSDLNRAPLEEILNRRLAIGQNLTRAPSDREMASAALKIKGDAFLATVLRFTPVDGMLAEQFDKSTGQPVSARDLTWSYAALLTATLARGDTPIHGLRSCSLWPRQERSPEASTSR